MAGQPVKVMYLADSYENPFAGTEGQMKLLLSGLDRSHFDPHLTLFRPSSYIEDNGFACPVNTLGIGSIARISVIIKLICFASSIKRQGFKIVHIFFNDASIVAPLILKLFGLKVIISRRDMGYWHTTFALLLLKINSFFVDHAVVNSEAVKLITSQKEKIALNKISVIYNGYENTSRNRNKDTLPGELTEISSEDELIIGLVANIRPIKRIDDVIRAMPKILAEVPNAKFVHIGGGDSAELNSLAQSLGVANSILFLGQKESPKVFMERFNVAVLCSESEGFSNSIIEYMKCHNPVVCTDVGGNPEIVIDGENGFLIKVGDIKSLADRVVTLLLSPELCSRMSGLGFTLVEREFSKEKMITKHQELYQVLVSHMKNQVRDL